MDSYICAFRLFWRRMLPSISGQNQAISFPQKPKIVSLLVFSILYWLYFLLNSDGSIFSCYILGETAESMHVSEGFRRVKSHREREEECCIEQLGMHIHGGGLAMLERSSQNGWTKTYKVNFFNFLNCVNIFSVRISIHANQAFA